MNKYAIAGKELMKGNFGNAYAVIANKSAGSELIYPSRYRNGNFFFGINGADKAFVWGNFNSSLLAYQKNPIVSAVVNKTAQATVNGKQFIMDAEGKEATTAQAKGLRKLLKKPNYYQTGTAFRAQAKVYKMIYGYCPILAIKPVGFENDYSRWKLWCIPPWMLQVEDNTDGMFYENTVSPFKRITLTYMGRSINLPLNSVFFLRENQISTSTYNMNSATETASLFLPDSKLFGLTENISNLISSLNSRGSLIREKGPMWILSNDANDSGDAGLFPINPKDKDELQDDFRQNYGIMAGQRKAIITDAKLKLQEVGFDVAQLKLLEGEVQDAKMICDGLNYPPYLLGLVDAKFDNQDIAERAWYTNSIIPDQQSDDEQFDELFNLEAIGLHIETDYSHLPALQENITEQGRGRWYMNQALLIEFTNGLLTWNEWREKLGDDTVKGMDKYYYELVAEGKIIPAPTAPAGNVSSDQAASGSASSGSTSTNNSNSNSNG